MVRRLGGTRPEPADAWVISATNTDLEAAVYARRFREDLYQRLAVLTLRLPPLRERTDDVILLAEAFLARVCADHGLAPKALSDEARQRLVAHPWPGPTGPGVSNAVAAEPVVLSDIRWNRPNAPPGAVGGMGAGRPLSHL